MREYRIKNKIKYKLINVLGILSISLFLFSVPVNGQGLSNAELDYWKSPEFQKRFAESYLAETDIEPKLLENEYKKMLKIRDLMESDKTDEVIKTLEKEIDDNSSAVFDFTLANIYFQKEELEKAAGYYEKATEKFPKFRRAWKNLGLVYIRKGELEKAIPVLTKVLELGGSDALTYAQLGYAYLSVNNNLCAESAYRMAVLFEPETLDWKVGLATSLLKEQRYAEAVSLFDNLIASDPNKTDLWLYQANAYIGMDQPLKAAVNFEMIDQMGKATINTLTKLGDIYVNQELFDTAVESYTRALQKDSNDVTENAGRISHAIRVSKVLLANGAFDECKKFIRNIETLQGNNLNDIDRNDLLKLRAQIAMSEGANDEQVKILEEIVKLDPLDGQALILLGQYYDRTGETEKAIFYYEDAENIEKFEADAKVRHAQLLVKQGKYKEAEPLLQRAYNLTEREDIKKYLDQVQRFATR